MAAQVGHPTKGVAMVMGAVLVFALADVVTKHLTTRYPVPVVVLLRGLCLCAASLTMAMALRVMPVGEAAASMLAPVTYLQLFWSGGLGWLIFGHIPDGWSLVGMGLVTVSGAAVALLSHFNARKARALAGG